MEYPGVQVAPPVDSDDSQQDEPSPRSEGKRRKLRKGTSSCWNCKRRKVKCIFASAADEKCVACKQRDTACYGQEVPEAEFYQVQDSFERKFASMMKVEGLLGKLVKQVGEIAARDGLPTTGILQSSSDILPVRHEFLHKSLPTVDRSGFIHNDRSTVHNSAQPSFRKPDASQPKTATFRNTKNLHDLSQALLDVFPTEEEVGTLFIHADRIPIFAYMLHVKSPLELEQGDFYFRGKLSERPSAETHPVLIARHMIVAALFLLQSYPGRVQGVYDHPYFIAQRLGDAASCLVTTNEGLHDSMESLECIILEGALHEALGNIRRAWLANRRALGLAQMMGTPLARGKANYTDPLGKVDPQYLWFRIIYTDRFLSLMLGIPCGSSDTSIISEQAIRDDIPLGRIQRYHAAIAGRILDRNASEFSLANYAITQEIDNQLLKAADSMPEVFWLPSRLAEFKQDSPEAFQEIFRTIQQLSHYHLLCSLHVPFLLRSIRDHEFEHSVITCTNASREILTRLLAYSSFRYDKTVCRPALFCGLIAMLTLSLAHLFNHNKVKKDISLSHQRRTDRAMIQSVLDFLKLAADQNGDNIAGRSVYLLGHLLGLEGYAAQGERFRIENLQTCEDLSEENEHRSDVLHLPIPYFGVIRIIRDDRATREPPSAHQTSVHGFAEPVWPSLNNCTLNPILASKSFETGVDVTTSSHLRGQLSALEPHGVTAQQNPPTQTGEKDIWQQQSLQPQFAAGVDDWPLQGVESAFFDSLMWGSNVMGIEEQDVELHLL